MIKEARWSGWVWVGECFLWYRPTRVVPDQRPLNGRCCCCCMLLLPEFSYKELWGTMEGSLHARNQLDRQVILIQYWRYRTIDPDWIQGNSSLVKEWSMDETVFRQKSLTRIQLTASRTPTTATTSKIWTTEVDQPPVHQPTNKK